MSHILSDLLYINEQDVYTTFGAFLCEDRPGDNTNYSVLMKPAAMKPYVAVNFRELDGEKLPGVLMPRFEPRDITLQFAIIAGSKTEFLAKYNAFVSMLKSGWISMRLPELGKTFRMYYDSCTEYTQLTPFEGGDVAGKFKIKFREPNPII